MPAAGRRRLHDEPVDQPRGLRLNGFAPRLERLATEVEVIKRDDRLEMSDGPIEASGGQQGRGVETAELRILRRRRHERLEALRHLRGVTGRQ